jgi:hypothetical protein
MPDTAPPESVDASELVSSSLLTALILSLINRGVLTKTLLKFMKAPCS